MFDADKIHRMTERLLKLPSESDNVYVVPEIFTQDAAALFKRLKIPVRAIMHDTTPQKEMLGFPVVKTAEASANFNERTALIILVNKTVPLIQTTFDFKVRGKTLTIPAFVMTNEEAAAIYDRVMFQKFIQEYTADGISNLEKNYSALGERVARGLTTFLKTPFQDFKYQLWDRREIFKPTYDFDDAAIVIQGPIACENNYTAETFKFYRSIYPNAPIVVSTWKGEATNNFRKACQENSVVLLENEPPKERGTGNVNLQLKTSFQGVKFIREHTSAKFVLKTRTDQRINRFEFLVYFKNLLETFPPKGDKLHQRIIFLGSNVTKAHPFHPHDFLAFGHILDISKLYDIPFFQSEQKKLSYFERHRQRFYKINRHLNNNICGLDYHSVTEQNHKLYKLNKMMSRDYSAEVYLARIFYEKYIAPIDETKLYETSWKFIVDYLILIDFETIKLDWPKYENMRYKQNFAYGGLCAFSWWLDLYRNFKIDWV